MADDNLDAYLMPKDSPYNTREPYVTAYDFDVTHQIPQGGINYTNLTPASRAYTAVISLSGEKGTFKEIQAALNYVNSVGGGRVLILPGTYTITQSLTMYGDTFLEGLSARDCILDFNNSTFNLSTVTSASNITISSLTFKNCRNTTSGTIFLDTALQVTIENCLFNNNKNGSNVGYDIFADAPTNVHVEKCISEDAATFYYADDSGFYGNTSFNTVRNNLVIDAANVAIQGGTTASVLGGGGGNTVYSGNTFTDGIKSVFSGQFPKAVISDNNLYWGSAVLTQVAMDFNDRSYNLRIVGNHIEAGRGGHVAIDIDTCNFITIIGNTITGEEASTPIILLTGTQKATITGNVVSNNNTISGMDGIKLVSADDTIITGNVVRLNNSGTSYAVNISNANCDRTVVVGNGLGSNTSDVNDAGTSSTVANNA